MPSAFEEEDFYRLNEVLSALPAEERVTTGANFLSEMGIEKSGANSAV